MDFATISTMLQDIGYNKVSTSNTLIRYDTLFAKGPSKISVKWQIGGHVNSVLAGEVFYESSKEFVKSFF